MSEQPVGKDKVCEFTEDLVNNSMDKRVKNYLIEMLIQNAKELEYTNGKYTFDNIKAIMRILEVMGFGR